MITPLKYNGMYHADGHEKLTPEERERKARLFDNAEKILSVLKLLSELVTMSEFAFTPANVLAQELIHRIERDEE